MIFPPSAGAALRTLACVSLSMTLMTFAVGPSAAATEEAAATLVSSPSVVPAARPATGRGVTHSEGLIAAYAVIAPTSVAQSQLVARAIVPAGHSCPTLRATRATAHGTKVSDLPMTVRRPGATALPAFSSVVVCSRSIPSGATKVTILGRNIPAALPTTINRIALISDTGCSVNPLVVQDCASSSAWPLRANAERIAREKPDVILDAGDYIYRETACPPADAAMCGDTPPPVAGMPFTDSDQDWLVDAITPMSPMFPVAPIAFLRGNHESCNAAGNGFFLFLDPRPDTAATCAPVASPEGLAAPAAATTPTWAVTLDISPGRTLRLAIVDSAYGADEHLTSWASTQRISYQQAQNLTARRKGRESWLLTHRPVFGIGSSTLAIPNDPQWTQWTSMDQTAASQGLLGNYSLILSSHLHLTQAVQIPGQPASLIMGNGGTSLDPPLGYATPPVGPLANADGTPVSPALAPYPTAIRDWTAVQFGFAMVSPKKQARTWSIRHESPAGDLIGRCQLDDRQLTCH